MVQAQDFRRPGYGYAIEDPRLLDEKFPDAIVDEGRPRNKDHIAPEEVISGLLRSFYWNPEFHLPDIVGIEVRYPQTEHL